MHTCIHDRCSKPAKARAMCTTHYNQTLPGRHTKIPMTCDGCGATCMKERRSRRYASVYCSDLCRDYTRFGPTTCRLPRHHISRWLGGTCSWTPPIPDTFECAWCGKQGTNGNRSRTYCDDDCKRRSKRARRRALEFGAPGTYTWAEVARLWIAFDKCCAYCRQPTSLPDIQAEHVEALSRGGANNLTNLLPSCAACNADKRELALVEWAADRERRGLPAVVTEWSDGDPRYRHLTARRHLEHAA